MNFENISMNLFRGLLFCILSFFSSSCATNIGAHSELKVAKQSSVDGKSSPEAWEEKSFNQAYIQSAMVTENKNHDEIIKRLSTKKMTRLLSSALGLSAESAEILDPIRRYVIYGKELDLVNLKAELGDVFWYLALMCDELGISFEEVMATNILKLQTRYPNKFNTNDAINRNWKKERGVLEKAFKPKV